MDAVSNAIGTPLSTGVAELRNLCNFQNSWTLIGCAIDAGNKNGLIAASLHPTSSCDARSVCQQGQAQWRKNVCSTQNVLDVARRKSDSSHAYADMSRHFARVDKTWYRTDLAVVIERRSGCDGSAGGGRLVGDWWLLSD